MTDLGSGTKLHIMQETLLTKVMLTLLSEQTRPFCNIKLYLNIPMRLYSKHWCLKTIRKSPAMIKNNILHLYVESFSIKSFCAAVTIVLD